MLKLFDMREKLIVGSKKEAEMMRDKADEMIAKFQVEYTNAKQESLKSFNDIKEKASKKYDEEIAKVKEESLRLIKENEKKLLAEELEIKNKIDVLSDEVAKEIISSLKKA